MHVHDEFRKTSSKLKTTASVDVKFKSRIPNNQKV
jgi:hypothetical protein